MSGGTESQCRIHFRVIPTEGETAKVFYPPTPLDHQLRAVGSGGGIFSQALLVCPEHGPTRQSQVLVIRNSEFGVTWNSEQQRDMTGH